MPGMRYRAALPGDGGSLGAVGLALGSRGAGCPSATVLRFLPRWPRGGGVGSAPSAFEASRV